VYLPYGATPKYEIDTRQEALDVASREATDSLSEQCPVNRHDL
jgi:hypothetical protein